MQIKAINSNTSESISKRISEINFCTMPHNVVYLLRSFMNNSTTPTPERLRTAKTIDMRTST